MNAPRDLARRDPWAQSVARALTPPAVAPAFAVERDLSDPSIWQESIWRSQRRREALERQLNFGPLTAKRVAVPLAMLAAGLMARDAIVSQDDGNGAVAIGAVTGAQRTASVAPAATSQGATAAASGASPAPKRHTAEPTTAASIAAARPPAPKPAMADGELIQGEHGAAVAAMQQKLGLRPDGIYGGSTLQAVETFQRRAGLIPDGRVGPATLRALERGVPAAPAKPVNAHRANASHSSHGRAHARPAGVRVLQGALKLPADGVFGRQTAHAVRAFQRQHGLKADGVVGPATWTALGMHDPGKVLREHRARSRGGSAQRGRPHRGGAHRSHGGGRHGGSVADLQRALGLPADGVFGRQTGRAVRAFQRKHGLKADGVVGPATWAALGVRGAHTVLHPRGASGSQGHRSSGGGGGGSASSSVVQRAIAAADRIAGMPYRYGGGHGSFQDSGYDCSGSVSYVLHGAGLLSSPLDSTGLMSYGEAGPGRHITIYANSGHAFMTIDGRRFDTGYGGNGNRWASGSRPSGGYVVRHPRGL